MAKKKKKNKGDVFVFRQADSVGAADAAEDIYLKECFVETGAFESLKDFNTPLRLVVGRTGSGKTALLSYLEETKPDQVILVRAESLALAHISNSTILSFLREINIKLDIFFKLLWRHVFAVEILKRALRVDGDIKRNTLERIRDRFRSSDIRSAINYLETWGGDKFWEKTDVRIKEITTKLERDIGTAISPEFSISGLALKGGANFNEKLSKEQKHEVISRAQEVVNSVQIKELSHVIDLVGKVLEEENHDFYVLVDRLDEDWVDEAVRYRLIRALVDTSRDFQKARRCKIIVALRRDLLDRVLLQTRDTGSQEEKIRSNILEIRWTQEKLSELLDARVNTLVKRRYTKTDVRLTDVMVHKIENVPALDYIIQRTLLRPRDAIHFINYCILESQEKELISVRAIKNAEVRYSNERLQHLFDEWHVEYPCLSEWSSLLKNRPASFGFELFREADFSDLLLKVLNQVKESDMDEDSRQFYEQKIDVGSFARRVLLAFYRVGLVGLRISHGEPIQWAHLNGRRIREEEVEDRSRVHVHKMFWCALTTSGSGPHNDDAIV